MSSKPRFHYLLYISWNFLANSLFASPLQRQQDRLPQPLMETMALQYMSTLQMHTCRALCSCRAAERARGVYRGVYSLLEVISSVQKNCNTLQKLKANLAGKKPYVHSAPSTQGYFSVVTARGPVHAQRQQK